MNQHHRFAELYTLSALTMNVTKELLTYSVMTITAVLDTAKALKAATKPMEQAAIDELTKHFLTAVLDGVETTTCWITSLLEAALREASAPPMREHTNGRDDTTFSPN
jgi:hypothetical protein